MTGATARTSLGLVAQSSILGKLIAGAILAILFAPCPSALAAVAAGLDPHACCHKSDDGQPVPASQSCETMCAKQEAERAITAAPPADIGLADLAPVALTAFEAPAPEAPEADDTSPPGPADIRLLTCTILI